MLCHVDFSLSFMFEITRAHCYVMSHILVCVCMVQQFKWKSSKNQNHLQKVLKSEMFEMLVFCCQFHRNRMVNENVMLKLDGKTHTK